jgi:hypothetical protein
MAIKEWAVPEDLLPEDTPKEQESEARFEDTLPNDAPEEKVKNMVSSLRIHPSICHLF